MTAYNTTEYRVKAVCIYICAFVSVPISGYLQLLEIYWNLKTLLEILEISLNLYGPPGNLCVKCRMIDCIGFQSR